MASASDFFDHEEALKETKTAQLTGSWSFSGGIECPETAAELDLESAGTGTITTFAAENLSKCKVIGSLAALGCTSATAFTKTGTWAVQREEAKLAITGVDLDATVKGGGLCTSGISLTLSNSGETAIFATPDATTAIKDFTFSGTLNSSTGTNVTVGGTLTMKGKDSGTYGLEAFP